MKTLFLILFIVAVSYQTYAQENPEASVESAINGIQVGYLTLSLNNEVRLARKLTLRSDVSFSPYHYRSNGRSSEYIVYPYFNFETRWYSNLDRRADKGKKTAGNTGNIWSLKATYSPDWVLLSNQENIVKSSLLSVGPRYIVRRTLGAHFNFEGSLDLEYGYIIRSTKEYLPHGGYFYGGVGLKIGYHFTRKN